MKSEKYINCLLHNCQDLFIFMDKYQNEDLTSLSHPKWQMLKASLRPNKNLQKIFSLAQTYLAYDCDILLLIEVGGPESLENFNRHFLNDQYQVFHAPSNSDRGIDMGFLVKKELAPFCTLTSHVQNKLSNQKLFSRGVLELSCAFDNTPSFTFFLTHLKSKLDIHKIDFEGRAQRQAEVSELARIYQAKKKQFPRCSTFICADLNGIYSQDLPEEEFRPFLETQLLDALDYKKASFEEKTSYFYFAKAGKCQRLQLDYLLGTKEDLASLVLQDTEIINFKNGESYHLIPRSLQQREKLPSDHYPYRFKLKLNC